MNDNGLKGSDRFVKRVLPNANGGHLEELLSALLGAQPERREDALRFLRGELQFATASTAQRANEPYLSLKAIGRELGVSPCTLWRWQVPGYDLGGRPRYKLSEVESYLKSEEFKRRAAALRAERRRLKGGARPTQNPPNALPANPRNKTH